MIIMVDIPLTVFVSSIGALLVTIGLIVGFFYYLHGKFEKISEKLSDESKEIRKELSTDSKEIRKEMENIKFSLDEKMSVGYKEFYKDIENMKSYIGTIKEDMKENKTVHGQLIHIQGAALSIHIESFASLLAILVRSGVIDKEEIHNLLKNSAGFINRTLRSISGGTGNPITKKEAEILNNYVNKARRNEIFTSEEAEEFYNLSSKVVEERSDDKGAWGILLLAAFILALYFLGKKDK